MDNERTYYSDEKGVSITGTKAILGSATYSPESISSIRIGEKPAKRAPGIWVASIGSFFLLVGGFYQLDALAISGLVMVAIGVFAARAPKAKYYLRITSGSGEDTALSSSSKGYLTIIENALREAIASRS